MSKTNILAILTIVTSLKSDVVLSDQFYQLHLLKSSDFLKKFLEICSKKKHLDVSQ